MLFKGTRRWLTEIILISAHVFIAQEIIVADGQLPEAEFNTIAHELSHAILEQMTLDKDSYDCEDMAKFGTYASYIVEQTKSIIEKLELGDLTDPNGTRTTLFIETRKPMTEAEILEWIKSNTRIIAQKA